MSVLDLATASWSSTTILYGIISIALDLDIIYLFYLNTYYHFDNTIHQPRRFLKCCVTYISIYAMQGLLLSVFVLMSSSILLTVYNSFRQFSPQKTRSGRWQTRTFPSMPRFPSNVQLQVLGA